MAVTYYSEKPQPSNRSVNERDFELGLCFKNPSGNISWANKFEMYHNNMGAHHMNATQALETCSLREYKAEGSNFIGQHSKCLLEKPVCKSPLMKTSLSERIIPQQDIDEDIHVPKIRHGKDWAAEFAKHRPPHAPISFVSLLGDGDLRAKLESFFRATSSTWRVVAEEKEEIVYQLVIKESAATAEILVEVLKLEEFCFVGLEFLHGDSVCCNKFCNTFDDMMNV